MSSHFARAAALAAACLPALLAAAPLTLDHALELAVARSQSTRAAESGVAGAREAAHAASQLPDPVLQAGIENLTATGGRAFDPSADSMTQKVIGVSQEWVSEDKRAARQAAADAMTARESVVAEVAVAAVRLQTAQAYLDVHYADATLALKELMEHHAHEELETAKGRISGATGDAQEALALMAARGAAADESDEVRQSRSVARAALSRWIGESVDETAEPVLPAVPGEEAFVDGAPDVRAARAALELAQREATVASKDRSPNWTWQLSYGQRNGYPDMVSVGVSVPFPIKPAERQDRMTAARQALVDQADAMLAEARRAATGEYLALVAEASHLAERIERVRATVLAPAQQRTASALAGYRGNTVPLTALFEARHAEVEAQLKLLELQRQLANTRVRLVYKPLQEGSAP